MFFVPREDIVFGPPYWIIPNLKLFYRVLVPPSANRRKSIKWVNLAEGANDVLLPCNKSCKWTLIPDEDLSTRIHYWPQITSQSTPFFLRFWDEKFPVHGSFTTCFTLKGKRLLEFCDAVPFARILLVGLCPNLDQLALRNCLQMHFITIYKGEEVWNNWQAWSWVPNPHFKLLAIPLWFCYGPQRQFKGP